MKLNRNATFRLLCMLSLFFILMSCLAFRTEVLKDPKVCPQDPVLLAERGKELQEIVKADQQDRGVPEALFELSSADKSSWIDLILRDQQRRVRVAQIFAEGCFSTAEDYAGAALVFQHGNVPDHFFQAFIWAKRAVELGKESSRHLMALTIDRYLVSTQRKQLFASQATKTEGQNCWCLYPVEKSFPDSLRRDYVGKPKRGQLDWLAELNHGKDCEQDECDMEFESPKHGDAPGIW